jgi:hypothetical protein
MLLAGYSGRLPGSGPFLVCSFCGQNQKQVKKLIAGPDVYICDWCISGALAVTAGPGEPSPAPGT